MKSVSISFDKFSDVNFQKKSQFIYDSMSGNLVYASLAAMVTAIKPVLDTYIENLKAAGTKDKNAVAKKNQSRQQLTALLKQLGLSVMSVADGDEAALVSSGFTLTKKPEPRYISRPGNVTLLPRLSSGEMLSMIAAVWGANSYVHQIATEYPTETTVWTSNTSTSSKFVFTNLIPGKQYWVRVAVVGSRNQIAYSTVATWFAQ